MYIYLYLIAKAYYLKYKIIIMMKYVYWMRGSGFWMRELPQYSECGRMRAGESWVPAEVTSFMLIHDTAANFVKLNTTELIFLCFKSKLNVFI